MAAPDREVTAAASLAIALGANLGDPIATLTAARPLLARELAAWSLEARAQESSTLGATDGPLNLRWSPLFRTAPVGGPPGQPPFINAVLLLSGPPAPGGWPDPQLLLARLQRLEARFGRQRREHWGPRTLDLDLLWCGDRATRTPRLQLPHPRLGARAFVIAPLAAIAPRLVPPGATQVSADLLARLLAQPQAEPPPVPLAGRRGWPEPG
jgi:2-amino-4-hydroxy-6-hydroxymethyldihydropteridine diphosphokinase